MIIIFIIFKSLKNKEYLSDDNKYYESLDLLSSHYNLSQKKNFYISAKLICLLYQSLNGKSSRKK